MGKVTAYIEKKRRGGKDIRMLLSRFRELTESHNALMFKVEILNNSDCRDIEVDALRNILDEISICAYRADTFETLCPDEIDACNNLLKKWMRNVIESDGEADLYPDIDLYIEANEASDSLKILRQRCSQLSTDETHELDVLETFSTIIDEYEPEDQDSVVSDCDAMLKYIIASIPMPAMEEWVDHINIA